MSCGFACRNCGYYEIAHEEFEIAEDWFWDLGVTPEDILPGYSESYSTCSGYESENPEAEAATNVAEEERRRWEGQIMARQTYVWMAFADGKIPFVYVSDDWRG